MKTPNLRLGVQTLKCHKPEGQIQSNVNIILLKLLNLVCFVVFGVQQITQTKMTEQNQ